MVRMVHMKILYRIDLQICGPMDENSKFRSSEKLKIQFWDQKWTFETESESETVSKYILDIPGVFPAHFPYIKYYF